MAGGSLQDVVNRELLRWAVRRQITCRRTGAVLDVRTAVYVQIDNSDGREIAAEVMAGAAWDAGVGEAVQDACRRAGLAVTVIDGRVSHG